jgi:hypothetical protein
MTVKRPNLTSVLFEAVGSYSLLVASVDALVDEKAWLGGNAARNTNIDHLIPLVCNNMPLTTFNPRQYIIRTPR